MFTASLELGKYCGAVIELAGTARGLMFAFDSDKRLPWARDDFDASATGLYS